MFKIISPEQFRHLLWKNGKGKTVELAVSQGGDVADFDWRISMASIVENGEFSDFHQYMRYMVLVEGCDLELHYLTADKNNSIDYLTHPLDQATFDGSCPTVGKVKSGAITNFNLMVKKTKYSADVTTYKQQTKVTLNQAKFVFAFGIESSLNCHSITQTVADFEVPAGHLLQLDNVENNSVTLSGKQMILLHLYSKG